MKRWFGLVWACVLAYTGTLTAQTLNTITRAQVRIPYGSSFLDFKLQPALTITPFQIVRDQTFGCPGFTANASVLYAGQNTWVPSGFANGFYLTENKPVAMLRIVFNQTLAAQQDCMVSVLSAAAQPPRPEQPMGQRIFAGLFTSAGGFQKDAGLDLAGAFYAREFEVLLPDYCSNVQVLEAGAFRLNRLLPATLVAGTKYRFRFDQPFAFDKINLTVIGPEAVSCQLPVYVYELAGPVRIAQPVEE